MATMICNAAIDERNQARGGAAGDQTGKEVCCKPWYSRPWNMMLRYKDADIARQAAEICTKIANSNLVGYDQDQRNSLYQELKKNNFDVDAYIRSGVRTETDCSAFVYAAFACLIPAMRYDGNAPTTRTMRSFYPRFGFTLYTDGPHLNTDANLKVGDLLNKEGSHVVIVSAVDGGSAEGRYRVTATTLNIRKGPGVEYPSIGYLHKDDVVELVEQQSKWRKLKDREGWVSLNYLSNEA